MGLTDIHRRRTSLCKGPIACAALEWGWSSRLVTTQSCEHRFHFIPYDAKPIVPRSGRIAKLSSMEATRLTTLQREILYFVLVIASLATAVAILIVILWAAWYVVRFDTSYILPHDPCIGCDAHTLIISMSRLC